jgi:hypothetical protein
MCGLARLAAATQSIRTVCSHHITLQDWALQLPCSIWLAGWHCKMHTWSAPLPMQPAVSVLSASCVCPPDWLDGAEHLLRCHSWLFHHLVEHERFVTVFTRARHWALFWARHIVFHLRSILMVSFHLLVGLPSDICPSWGSSSCSATLDMSTISYNSEVHCRAHKSPPPVPILSHLNPVHTLTSNLCEIHFNIIFPSRCRFF